MAEPSGDALEAAEEPRSPVPISLTEDKILCAVVSYYRKPAVYVNCNLSPKTEKDNKILQFIVDKITEIYGDVNSNASGNDKRFTLNIVCFTCGLVFFNTQEEQNTFYEIFNVENLTYESNVYACAYDETGKVIAENR